MSIDRYLVRMTTLTSVGALDELRLKTAGACEDVPAKVGDNHRSIKLQDDCDPAKLTTSLVRLRMSSKVGG